MKIILTALVALSLSTVAMGESLIGDNGASRLVTVPGFNGNKNVVAEVAEFVSITAPKAALEAKVALFRAIFKGGDVMTAAETDEMFEVFGIR